ncbi:hypothetical protein SUGI_0865930 [Cryptomeria japonica]|nr:hypothetical protein SUGI_0865930 [Cryptomeria japonica]
MNRGNSPTTSVRKIMNPDISNVFHKSYGYFSVRFSIRMDGIGKTEHADSFNFTEVELGSTIMRDYFKAIKFYAGPL